MASFRTRLDYSNNRQIIQRVETLTHLSGGTLFGIPFSGLTSGPDLSTTGYTEQYTFIGSTFSGNSATTVYNWYDSRMTIAEPYLSAITPANSGVTQYTGQIYVPNNTIVVDGNTIALDYSGVSFDVGQIQIYDLGGGNYSGSVDTSLLLILSAQSLDYSGRTVWVDNPEITRTGRLIITNNPQPGYVFTCLDSEGMGGWVPVSGSTSGNTFTTGATLNGSVIEFNRNDISNAYNVDLNPLVSAYTATILYETSGISATQRVGVGNSALGDFSAALGGQDNAAKGVYTFIGGGKDNSLTSDYASIVGGSGNTNSLGAVYGFIGGGLGNYIGDEFASILGGQNNSATGITASVINGFNNLAINDASIVLNGSGNTSSGVASIVGGANNLASNTLAISFGLGNTSSGNGSFTHGGIVSFAGYPVATVSTPAPNSSTNDGSFAVGGNNLASGINSFVSGSENISSGVNSHAEGEGVIASGTCSHAEGGFTVASAYAAHAEGRETTAIGLWSHSQNSLTEALGQGSHSGGEGFSTTSKIISSGRTSFAHFRISSNIGNRGVYGLDSAILGGVNHNIYAGVDSSAILGGDSNIISGSVINSVVIGGSNITANTSNTVYVPDLVIDGLTSTDPLATDVNGKIIAGVSDIRLKKNIVDLPSALDVIKNLRGVAFEYTEESNMGSGVRFGFIAQEVKEVVPELVRIRAKGDGMLNLNYTEIIPWIIEAIKELTNGNTVTNELILETQTIAAEDNNIELNYNGTNLTAIGGGVSIINGISDGINAEFKLNSNGDWVANNCIIPSGLVIPNYTPTSNNDSYGKLGEITTDDNYLYIKGNNGWKRLSLESF
jgi:hypothetical protein